MHLATLGLTPYLFLAVFLETNPLAACVGNCEFTSSLDEAHEASHLTVLDDTDAACRGHLGTSKPGLSLDDPP